VKDIRRESFLSNLLFSGIDSEIQREGGWVEGKETDVTHVAGIATFNEQQHLYFAVHRNLLSRVCVRILTFGANFISDSYSAIQTVYIDQPAKQQFTPAQIKHSALSV